MARFLISVMPFTGHVAPLSAVAAELVRRGHDVRVYTGSAFRGRIEAVGGTLVPWRAAPEFDENNVSATFPRLVGKKGLSQLLINMEDLFINTAPKQNEDLDVEWARQPWDVMVSDEASIAPALFAERTGCPWANVAVLPLNLRSAQGPPTGIGLQPGRNPLTKARDALLRAAVPLGSRPLRAPTERARVALDLPKATPAYDEAVFSRQLIIASGIPALDHHRTDRPAWVHYVGELTSAAKVQPLAELPPWWAELHGRVIVHVTQGTQNIDPEDLIRPTTEALADRDDVLVVVTTGVHGRDRLPFPVPANTRVAGFLPYAELLPRVDTVISNGGWGGVLAVLARGIPLVIGGGDLDKPEVAARVAGAGAGINLRTGTPKPKAIAAAFDRVRTDASFRASARRVAAELAAAGGAPRAVELIETLLP
ncbi:glycosyltransferase [Microbacterium sp. DT81.1]|uniref:glycosyltransferase n=1 Tax=Microbacterium sp. DT81.1 TaxID=3393413 RepID=UPI003CF6C1BD